MALALFTVPARFRVDTRQRVLLKHARTSRLPFETGYLRVYHWGTNGPAVLLAHGWSSCAARLTEFVTPLVQAGFQVIAFDAPAHGYSSGLSADAAACVRALLHVKQHFDPVRAVIGHSLGARAAMLLLSREQCVETRAAVLIASPPDVRYMFEQFKLVLALRLDVQQFLNDEFARAFGDLPESLSIGSGAPQPRCPVLLVHDQEDEVAPFLHAQALAHRLPHATLLATRELRHCGALTHFGTISDIVCFMKLHAQALTHSKGIRGPGR
jgi:pimeloyl-ACP methyl ester carboxylesterase